MSKEKKYPVRYVEKNDIVYVDNRSTILLYDQLRDKIADSFNLQLWLLCEQLDKAENGKRLVDRNRGLFGAQDLAKDLLRIARIMGKTFSINPLDKSDYQQIEDEFGKDIADYERMRDGVIDYDDSQS